MDNVFSDCPFCGYDLDNNVQCLICGSFVDHLEYMKNGNSCPTCQDNPIKHTQENRKIELESTYSFIRIIKPFHEFIIKRIKGSSREPINDWLIGALIFVFLILISSPLIIIVYFLLIVSQNIFVIGFILFVIYKLIKKEFPDYLELFKLRTVGLALLKSNNIKYNSLTSKSILILRSYVNDDDRVYKLLMKYSNKYLQYLGPVFTFGKPGDLFRTSGTTKIYIDAKDNWYKVLKDSINRAKLIFLFHGDSEGLIWEFKQCILANIPSKLFMIIPKYESQEEYSRINSNLNNSISHLINFQLPISNNAKKHVEIMGFDKNWKPYIIKPNLLIRVLFHISKTVKFDSQLFIFAGFFQHIYKCNSLRFPLLIMLELTFKGLQNTFVFIYFLSFILVILYSILN